MANSQPKGVKYGGRKKGTPNRSTGKGTIRQRVEALGGDYLLYLVSTMNNNIACATCRGEGKTKFQPRGNSMRFQGIRTCQSCWGSKLEKIAPSDSQKAATTLMEYCETKLKAVDHTVMGPNGGPVQHKHEIVLVE